MRLVFDARPIAGQFTGLGRYTASLLRSLLTSYSANDFHVDVLLQAGLNWDSNFHFSALKHLEEIGRCRIHYVPAPAISLSQQWKMPSWVNELGGDVYFYPHFDPPLGIKIPIVFVVHDLIPIIVPGYVQRFAAAKKFYFQSMVKAAVARSHRCMAVSKTTAADVIGLVGEKHRHKVAVAYEGPVLDVGGEAPVLPDRLEINYPYFLYVGDRRPHKNLKRVVDMFFLLRDIHGYQGKLLLVGSTNNFGFDLDAYVAGRDDVRVVGTVSDLELAGLYAHTDALFFLSAYEGFGLPVVEAARFGIPMILSDGGSLAEIAPPGSCTVPCAMSVEDGASKAAAYLRDYIEQDRSEYLARYTWLDAAKVIFPEAYQ